MPSERFFKLSEDKQQRIIEASTDEFIASGMHDASINRIIKDADISRGSFYTYFEDKNDLFNFIFSTLKHSSASMILDEIEKKNGDVFAAAKALVERGSVADDKKDKTTILFDKLMSDFGIMAHISEIPREKAVSQFTELYRKIYAGMNDLKEDIPENKFFILADMMIMASINALVAIKRDPGLKDEILGVLYKQYEIMEKGIKGGALK